MRVAAVLLVLLSLALLAGAAYLGHGWQVALYLGVVVWTLTALFGVCVVLEVRLEPAAAWVRAALAATAGAGAFAVSLRAKPGSVPEPAFADVIASATQVGALGLALAALVLGGAAVKRDRRGANVLAGLGMLAAVAALRGWLHGGT